MQALIDAAEPGSTVVAPDITHDIDALDDAEVIWIRKSLTLDLGVTTIRIKPNDANNRVYFAIGIVGDVDVTIRLGIIKGDRDGHIPPKDDKGNILPVLSGLGHGIAIDQGARVKLQGGAITECMGDGVCCFWGSLEMEHVTLKRNRRQGTSVASCDSFWAHDCDISNNGGVSPGAGIDFEPDPDNAFRPPGYIHNVRVERCWFASNAGAAVLIACPPERRKNVSIMSDNLYVGCPIDGTDGITPLLAKCLAYLFGKNPGYKWYGYKRELHIP